MKHHAKASSAGTTKGAGRGLVRRVLATRGVSSAFKGSGARPVGRLFAALALAIGVLALAAAPASAAPVGAKIGTVSNVLGGSAHVTGEVDPGPVPGPGEEAETYFTFEYSTDNVNWSGFTFEGYATGEGFREVSADLKGLKGGTKYFIRLTARNFREPDVVSPEPNPEFETLPVTAPTVLATGDATEVAYTTAHVSGEVLRPSPLNPDPAFDANCGFEYISDAQFTQNEAESLPGFSGAARTACNHDPVKAGEGAEVEASLTNLTPATTYHLRLTAANAGGSDSKVAADTFTTLTVSAPVVSINPVTTFAGTTAEFTGTIVPGGTDPTFNSSCAFDYVTEAAFQAEGFASPSTASAPCTPAEPIEGASAVAVSAAVTGLEPSTTYRVRIRSANVGGVSTAEAASFTTLKTAPEVTGSFATDTLQTTAILNARIKPDGAPTTYHFEYLPLSQFLANGETFAGAQLTPESAPIGADNSAHLVTAKITGLTAGAGYRFRVVATNSVGQSQGTVTGFETQTPQTPQACPNEASRIGLSTALPDCRAYEQVSPVLKNGFDVGALQGVWNYAVATADGNGLLYASRGPIGEATRGLQEYTVGRRGADGWSARSALPASPVKRVSLFGHSPVHLMPSADLGKLLFGSSQTYGDSNPASPNASPPETASGALYLSDSAGDVTWLTRPQVPNPTPAPGEISSSYFQAVGGSPDLSTVYFWGLPTLLPSDAARAGNASNAWGLYEYSGGTLRSAGTLPDGSEDPGGAAPASSGFSERLKITQVGPERSGNQVSEDGSTLWFVSPDPGNVPSLGPVTQLYVRRAGHSTLVSHAPDGTPAPDGVVAVNTLNGIGRDPRAHQFAFGSPDGTASIFQSTDALAAGAPNDSSVKSYRYDVATNTVTYLPGVDGATIVAASDDGQRFLFGSFSPGEPLRIGVWDHGTIKPIAPVGSDTLAPARATPSGSAFVFSSSAPIPGFNNGGVQIYRYDLAQEKTICLSCAAFGAASSDATMVNQNPTGTDNGEVIPDRGMSENAGRVFFQTASALVPQDTNGVQDVYEWTPSGVSLISTGRSHDPSIILDNSASGDDVFFATSEGLDPQDTDGSYDVYDARVDGGFAAAAQVTPCEGEACQGPSAPPPGPSSVGSRGLEGRGNQKQAGKARCGKTRVTAHADGKARCTKKQKKHKHHKQRTAKKSRRAGR